MPAWNEPPAALAATVRDALADLAGGDELILVVAGPEPPLPPDPRLRVERAAPGRGVQLNRGAALARGEWLLFLHADSRLGPGALEAVRGLTDAPAVEWGWLTLRLDAPRLGYRVIERGIRFRSWASGGATGDQAIFVRRRVFEELGGFPAWPLCEDLDLVDRLRRRSPGRRLDAEVRTSPRRYARHGLVRTTLRMWALRVAFRCGVTPTRLAAHFPPVREPA